jgi:hypothetical protein
VCHNQKIRTGGAWRIGSRKGDLGGGVTMSSGGVGRRTVARWLLE